MLSYNSYAKNSTFPPPTGSGGVTPCPAGFVPQLNDLSPNPVLALAPDGPGATCVFTIPTLLSDLGEAGAVFPPCDPDFVTTGAASEFTWQLLTSGDVVIAPFVTDTKSNGLLNQYKIDCTARPFVQFKVEATGPAGSNTVSVACGVVDALAACP